LRTQRRIVLWFEPRDFSWRFLWMDNKSFYIPFTKKDSDQRVVEGFASTEALDTQGEIVKLSAIEKALKGYLKFPTIREMHQWSAVGRTIYSKIDKKKKGLFVRGKIVDKEAWEKVKEGVYNGFSIGGKIKKKLGNVIYEVDLNEISLVDRPANPEAVFSLVKIKDGKVVEKQMPLPVAPVGLDGEHEPKFVGVKLADKLIAMAASLTTTISMAEEMGRKTKHIEKALTALKDAARVELETEKVAIEKELGEKNRKKLEELTKIKDFLERAVAQKQVNLNWSNDYFKELKKAL